MTYQPLYRHRPSHRWTYGDIAAKVGADLGLPPDDEQKWILDSIYAEKAPDRPASFEVGVISPRQNIKTSTLGIAALSDLFVFDIERHIWSSHLVDTTKSTFTDFKGWIESNPEYSERADYYEGHQDLAIYLKDQPRHRIEFRSRTGKASRGLTRVKRITLDEALYLEPKHIGAVYPTMLTRPGAQVRIGSSAGLLTSEQLRRIRDRGRSRKDPRLAYVEYGAQMRECTERGCLHIVGTPGCALDDRDLWWQANCALWAGRVLEESIEDMRKSMPPEEFMREFFSWWEDPASLGGALPYGQWLELKDPDAERGDLVVFGLDLSGDRDVWIAVAWQREDGSAHVMLTNEGKPLPVRKAVGECSRLHQEWGGPVATSALGEELVKADVQVVDVTGPEFAVACGALADAITDGTIRHANQPALNEAVKLAPWRTALQSGERALDLRVPGIGPVAAAVRALHGLANLDVDVWGFFE
ncbi:MAG TPA: hypothetical protein VIR15_13695 [Intrasporangium sp.]|uniref:hypothetical protein n=1 Tax=Intrasporangium sp. TaxID=1925024 RepID=UPI002F91E153